MSTVTVHASTPAIVGQSAALLAAVGALVKVLGPQHHHTLQRALDEVRSGLARSHLAGRDEMLKAFQATADAIFDLGPSLQPPGDKPATPGGDW